MTSSIEKNLFINNVICFLTEVEIKVEKEDFGIGGTKNTFLHYFTFPMQISTLKEEG